MPTFRVTVEDHDIEIRSSLWSGRETVTCDGVVVSDKRSWQLTTAHGFEVVDKSGRRVVYEVDLFGGFAAGFALRRDGILMAASPRNLSAGNSFRTGPEDASWSRVGSAD